MKIAVPKETAAHESRVAATPETIKKMIGAGFSVSVETGAGVASQFLDDAYQEVGASIAANFQEAVKDAAIVLKVQKPSEEEFQHIDKGTVLIGFFSARFDSSLEGQLNTKGIAGFSLDGIPRIARAQKLDVLSSQSNVAGYKAVLMAADRLGIMMPLMMTAAGTVTPAKVFVLGAGVAGLQAIATAKRLGAVVEAFDTRPVVKDQVESLGGKFLQIETEESTEDEGGYAKEVSEETHRKEVELVAKHAAEADIIITTALIPGKPAPVLIPEEVVKTMKPGSVIVDLAAQNGGNCPLTKADEEIEVNGVHILGHTNLPSLVASDASQLYARNLWNFLEDITSKGNWAIDVEDEVVQGALCSDANNLPAQPAASTSEESA